MTLLLMLMLLTILIIYDIINKEIYVFYRCNMFYKIKNWFHNYWYYYKWGVIIVGAFALILLICVIQGSKKQKYDVGIIYTGPHFFEVGEKDEIISAFQNIMSKDYNGDKKKAVDFVDMPAFTDDQIDEAIENSDDKDAIVKYAPYTVENVQQNFSSVVFAGDVSICLLDEYWYNILLEAGGLVKLTDVFEIDDELLRDDYSVTLSDLEIYEYYSAISKLPEDTILCFRTISTASAFTGKKQAEKIYGYSSKMFRDIVNFK